MRMQFLHKSAKFTNNVKDLQKIYISQVRIKLEQSYHSLLPDEQEDAGQVAWKGRKESSERPLPGSLPQGSNFIPSLMTVKNVFLAPMAEKQTFWFHEMPYNLIRGMVN